MWWISNSKWFQHVLTSNMLQPYHINRIRSDCYSFYSLQAKFKNLVKGYLHWTSIAGDHTSSFSIPLAIPQLSPDLIFSFRAMDLACRSASAWMSFSLPRVLKMEWNGIQNQVVLLLVDHRNIRSLRVFLDLDVFNAYPGGIEFRNPKGPRHAGWVALIFDPPFLNTTKYQASFRPLLHAPSAQSPAKCSWNLWTNSQRCKKNMF